MNPAVNDFLSTDFLDRLSRLDVLSRKILAGKLSGERPARRRGNSIEFADFRDYSPGDDPRFIDWNAYARLDRLLLKLFVAEEELSVHILVDSSKSCDWGLPNKSLYLKQLAAALGYVGLVNQHHLTLCAFADGIVAQSGPLRGRANAARMIAFLGEIHPRGVSRFTRTCEAFGMSRRRKGVCLVLSDFFFAEGLDGGLAHLRAGEHELWCVQVLSPQEKEPATEGEVRLIDMEENTAREGRINPVMIQQYQANLQAYCQDVERRVIEAGGNYLSAVTDCPVDELVLNCLRERGLLG